jgi:hypothetical protein
MSNDDIKTVHAFQKNALEAVWASISRFKGREYIDPESLMAF